ncbi:MAG: hypothetical protein MJA30_25240, partial [Cytophagales bacterium]|nr:hypothetical protein [Cytophagales bacterium]
MTNPEIKPKLSIQRIGHRTFFFGIFIGLSIAFVFYLFLNGSREVIRYISSFNDLMILDGSTIFMSNLLFAGLALLLGMSFCIRHWVSNGLKTTQPTRFRRNRIIHNSLFSTWTNLAFLCRMLSLYGIVLVMSSNHVDMEIFGPYRYWVLVLLLALFFQQWNDLALFYRCRLWGLSSLLVVSTLALIFAQVELHNYAKYDRLYLQEQQARYEYIDRELNRALQWGIQYDDETLRTIHFKKSTRTIQWQKKIIDHLNDPNKPMDL